MFLLQAGETFCLCLESLKSLKERRLDAMEEAGVAAPRWRKRGGRGRRRGGRGRRGRGGWRAQLEEDDDDDVEAVNEVENVDEDDNDMTFRMKCGTCHFKWAFKNKHGRTVNASDEEEDEDEDESNETRQV